MGAYRNMDHTADLALAVEGDDRADLFVTAARALFEQITDPAAVEEEREEPVELRADGAAELLRAWLSELLYLFEVRDLVGRSVSIEEISDTSLRARVRGASFDPDRHPVLASPKAVTRHRLSVRRREGGGWRATVVIDV